MNRIHESSRLSKKLAAASGLILALAALTAASAQAALTVPHVIKPEEVRATPVAPQPRDPSDAPGPDLPATSPSSSDQQGGDGQEASPGPAPTSESNHGPYNDVGNGALRADSEDLPDGAGTNVEFGLGLARARFDQVTTELAQNLSSSPVGDFLEVLALGNWIARAEDRLNSDAAVREILGYSGVSDQVCGGSSFESTNGDLEDPNNGIAFC